MFARANLVRHLLVQAIPKLIVLVVTLEILNLLFINF